ncbi:MAG TPA: hypothetical protein VK558_12645 [Patescibacteria group bacterium]|nr:hypothetical protein [Patescibacteria group bacterium]
MSCSRPLLVFAALSGLLSACSPEPPFQLTDYRYAERGIVEFCYSPSISKIADFQGKADEACRPYDRVAKFSMEQPGQCSWTAPNLAIFQCIARPGENPPVPLRKNAPMRHDPAID